MLVLATIVAQDTDTGTVPAQLVLAVLCVIVLSSVALGVCIGLARRMQQIAAHTPRKNPPSPTDDSTNDQAPD